MNSPAPDCFWEDRSQLDQILEQAGVNVFEWLCLDASPRWVKWEAALGEAIYRDVVTEEPWSYSSRSGSIYLPDITPEKMVEADQSIRSSGLVGRVDQTMAEIMLTERASYDDTSYVPENLLDLRLLSDSGSKVWTAVREMQGFRNGFQFIKLLSKSPKSSVRSVSSTTSLDLREGMVFHSPLVFRPELLCEKCVSTVAQSSLTSFGQVGPWFDPFNQVWPGGWRLICPHAV